MPSEPRVPVGLPRVAAATGLMLGAAVGAHAAAGGTVPPAIVVGLLGALFAVVAAVVARTGPRRRRSLLLVGAAQYAAHQLLAMASHWPAAPLHPAAVDDAGHRHGAVTPLVAHPAAGGDVPGAAAGTELTAAAVWLDGRMLLGHLAATVVVGLVLATGDRVVAAARTALRRRWRITTAVPGRPVPARILPVLDAPAVVVCALVCLAGRPRRGPPSRGVAPLLAA